MDAIMYSILPSEDFFRAMTTTKTQKDNNFMDIILAIERCIYSFTVQPRGDYWVISTDYDSYAVVWSCSEQSIPFLRFKWNTREFKLPV